MLECLARLYQDWREQSGWTWVQILLLSWTHWDPGRLVEKNSSSMGFSSFLVERPLGPLKVGHVHRAEFSSGTYPEEKEDKPGLSSDGSHGQVSSQVSAHQVHLRRQTSLPWFPSVSMDQTQLDSSMSRHMVGEFLNDHGWLPPQQSREKVVTAEKGHITQGWLHFWVGLILFIFNFF